MYLEKFRLDGKIAVITGAARGIGFATADALSEAGAAVVITDMNGEAAKRAAAELSAKGRKISSATLDVTDPRAVERVHAEIVRELAVSTSWSTMQVSRFPTSPRRRWMIPPG